MSGCSSQTYTCMTFTFTHTLSPAHGTAIVLLALSLQDRLSNQLSSLHAGPVFEGNEGDFVGGYQGGVVFYGFATLRVCQGSGV